MKKEDKAALWTLGVGVVGTVINHVTGHFVDKLLNRNVCPVCKS